MLDTVTRRRIDTARDILVGKVPDPKSQVEQITIALIYKFMDDMDAEAEEFGGERTFFAGEFARYGWAQLMRGDLGGHEMLGRYAEAIERMPQNPGIPELFRQIFRNTYLPYRDPETLRAFLKEIDGFTYDHSERLGDAFEYLLQVLGSQGDAGQFRTPRHIIDFMVEIVNPQKDDVILDPACGTAGFLISAYKHIRRQNSSNPEAEVPDGQLLSITDRERLARNIQGYDISPDMVRLSLVNMYLHHFPDPKIFEYDTLTSEERWDEYADVILANPPFMSPKGGIRPHKRFSVQSKRSEVLFVDYIYEHLTPNGRAGIIVPEGVIFQSQTAYKQLRKLLVDEALVAVISLPAGVFNPYSGVKTSILILDKSLAKRSSTVGFFRVDHDGFSLGSQRREGGPNDLPQVLAEVNAYRNALAAGEPVDELVFTHGLVVDKDLLAKNGDYNLSGERYREFLVKTSSFPLRRFEDVCTLEYGASLPKPKRKPGPYPVVGSNGVTGYHDEYLVLGPAIVIGRKGSAGEVNLVEENCFPIDTTYFVRQTNPQESDIYFLYHVLRNLNLPELQAGAGIPGLNRNDVYSVHSIPLPPLEVQREIVAEIEGYQKVIDGARAVVENYRPQIAIDPSWPVVELGEHLSAVVSGITPRGGKETYVSDGVLFIRSQNVLVGSCDFSDAVFIEEAVHNSMSRSKVQVGDVFLNITGASIGRSAVMEQHREANVNQHVAILRPNEELLATFLSTYLNSKNGQFQIRAMQSGASREALNYAQIRQITVPLPPLETQQTIVEEIEAEQRIVDGNRQLVERMQAKIDAVIARVWGEPAGAAPLAEPAPELVHQE